MPNHHASFIFFCAVSLSAELYIKDHFPSSLKFDLVPTILILTVLSPSWGSSEFIEPPHRA